MGAPCTQEGAIEDIKGLVGALTKEMRSFVNEMRDIAIEDREHRIKIQQVEKETDLLFTRLRRLEDDVIPSINSLVTTLDKWQSTADGLLTAAYNKASSVEKWKNKVDGGFKVVLIIPSILSAVSVILVWVRT